MAARSKSKKSTSRSSKKASKKKAASGPSRLERLRERLRAVGDATFLGISARDWTDAASWTAVVVVAIVAWVRFVPGLEDRAAAAATVPRAEVVLTQRPSWMPADLVDAIESDAAMLVTGDPFARTELIDVGLAVRDSGWFASIDQVRRVTADRIEVTATPLVPFALVRDRAGDHLVDLDGHLMPPSYETDDGPEDLVVITGARSTRPPAAGQRWTGREIAAALDLLRRLDGKPWIDQIATVDASRYAIHGDLSIATDIGARIHWNSPPGDERPTEPTADAKIAMLDEAYRENQSGRIDSGYAGQWYFYQEGMTAR